MADGWRCPVCERVYAPHVESCSACGQDANQDDEGITASDWMQALAALRWPDDPPKHRSPGWQGRLFEAFELDLRELATLRGLATATVPSEEFPMSAAMTGERLQESQRRMNRLFRDIRERRCTDESGIYPPPNEAEEDRGLAPSGFHGWWNGGKLVDG